MNYRDLPGDLIQPGGNLVIQTHDYPDFDAVASAFALGEFLGRENTFLVAGGDLDSFSLQETIRQLKIPLIPLRKWVGSDSDQVILVDAQPGGTNITLVPGRVLAAIDHHPQGKTPTGCYLQIEPDTGACSTLIHGFYKSRGQTPSKNTATALMMGIMMDTGFLTRGVTPRDLESFNDLYFLGDWKLGSYMLKNSLSVASVPRFQEALRNLKWDRGLGFTWLDDQAGPETIALIADDFMRFHEIQFVAVAAPSGEVWRISARSEDPLVPAGEILYRTLDGLGKAGGHNHMAGGTVPPEKYPGPQELLRLLRNNIDICVKKEGTDERHN